MAYVLSCSTACGIFRDQGWNPCALHWQQILNHCATREVQIQIFNFLFLTDLEKITTCVCVVVVVRYRRRNNNNKLMGLLQRRNVISYVKCMVCVRVNEVTSRSFFG